MSSAFLKLYDYVKTKPVVTDNIVFRLNYVVTGYALWSFSIAITTKQIFGDPIHCIGSSSHNLQALNAYCWIYGTHSVRKQTQEIIGRNVAQYGVSGHSPGDTEDTHYYYQWVCIVLLLQAFMFYIPRFIWRLWEGGKVCLLTEDLGSPMIPEKWNDVRKSTLVNYLIQTSKYTHNFYGYRYAVCEVLNLANVAGQIFLLDSFLGGKFRSLGSAVAMFQSGSAGPGPLDVAFPKLAKCTWHSYGSSGSLQLLDLVCVLPLNVVNEKIYVVLWFWFIILTVLNIVALIYRFLLFTTPWLRIYIMCAQARLVPRFHIANIVEKFSVDDWFMLRQIGKNLNSFVFKELLLEVSRELDSKCALV